MPYSAICANCGITYIRSREVRGITCSYACRAAYFLSKHHHRECLMCGKQFAIAPSSFRRNCLECSPIRPRSPIKYIAVTETDKAYLAGVIDGEGCITAIRDIRKKRIEVTFQICVRMSARNVIELFSELYGGNVTVTKYKNNKWSTQYQWRASGERGEKLLWDILPYLRVKYEQAELYLKARATFTGIYKNGVSGRVSPSDIEMDQRLGYAHEIIMLNQKVRR